MKILVIEDKNEKFEQIKDAIEQFCCAKNITSKMLIHQVDCMAKVQKPIHSNVFDLIIFDVYLPYYPGDIEERNVAKDIILAYKDSINASTDSIVLTAQPNYHDNTLFNENAVVFVEYDEDNGWVKTLNSILDRVSKKISYDFLIFCALTKERHAYHQTSAKIHGSSLSVLGLDCLNITIGTLKGLCIKPLRMGLVNMAITATRAIELFRPRFVGISGICAGQADSGVNLLDVIVGTVAWEYQTGKYQGGVFSQEPYQSSLSPEQTMEVSRFIEDQSLKAIISQGLESQNYINAMTIRSGPVASGSLVIADEAKMLDIKASHRSLLGLDMEISALYAAALQADTKPSYLAIKTATDFGNLDKSLTDPLQDLGAVLSARCMVEYITRYLKP